MATSVVTSSLTNLTLILSITPEQSTVLFKSLTTSAVIASYQPVHVVDVYLQNNPHQLL